MKKRNSVIQNSGRNFNSNFCDAQRFEIIEKVEIIIPEDYDHSNQLNSLEPENDFAHFNYKLSCDKCFSKTTDKLQPGNKYISKIFQGKNTDILNESLKFLKNQKSLLINAQGASLIWQLYKEILPLNRWTLFFDNLEALPLTVSGFHEVPGIYRCSNGNHSFDLGNFERGYYSNINSACFIGIYNLVERY